jgi:prepilin-type N-terminal cleavage/methylation domain-containing protein
MKLPQSISIISRIERQRGFTLLEIMVSLILGALIMGGVMGSISVSLQYSQRVREKIQVQSIIEAAAQELLANPHVLKQGALILNGFPGAPSVVVQAYPIEVSENTLVENPRGELYRVMLIYGVQRMEFSIIVPPVTDEG